MNWAWPQVPAGASWRIYAVGGCVRDLMLGQAASDRDWVAVGARPEELLQLGYRPVGNDFPVFLHPDTHDEVALARTERKKGRGYHGFEFHAHPEVTLEEDLARRDLSINAMAMDDQGRVIDPYGGQSDLEKGVLRHVTSAFAEDPVRILRLARFCARWPHWRIANETLDLMKQMVDAGEVDQLVPERVWQEWSKGLMSDRPSRMWEVLDECGALSRLLPELVRLRGVPQPPEHHPEIDTWRHVMMVIDRAAHHGLSLAVRWACLGHDFGKGETPSTLWPKHHGHEQKSERLLKSVQQRITVPREVADLALIVAREHGHIHASGSFGGEALVRLLGRLDVWRKPDRLESILWACQCDSEGRLGRSEQVYPPAQRLRQAAALCRSVDTADIAAQSAARGLKGPEIAAAIFRARAALLSDWDQPQAPM